MNIASSLTHAAGAAFSQSGLLLLAACLVGLATGLVHFAALRWNAGLYVKGGAARAAIIQIARFALLVTVLVVLAKLGAGPLLAGALGIFSARHIVLRRERAAS